jgi:hypothetical protein
MVIENGRDPSMTTKIIKVVRWEPNLIIPSNGNQIQLPLDYGN